MKITVKKEIDQIIQMIIICIFFKIFRKSKKRKIIDNNNFNIIEIQKIIENYLEECNNKKIKITKDKLISILPLDFNISQYGLLTLIDLFNIILTEYKLFNQSPFYTDIIKNCLIICSIKAYKFIIIKNDNENENIFNYYYNKYLELKHEENDIELYENDIKIKIQSVNKYLEKISPSIKEYVDYNSIKDDERVQNTDFIKLANHFNNILDDKIEDIEDKALFIIDNLSNKDVF